MEINSIPKTPSIIIYADNRAGKSWLLGSAYNVEKLHPVYLIDGEYGGDVTVRDMFKSSVDPTKMTSWQFEKGKPVGPQIAAMLKDCIAYKPNFIGWDGASYMMSSLVYELANGSKLSFNHWQAMFVIMKKLAMDLLAVSPNLVVTCLPDWLKDGDNNIVGVQPYIPGNKFPMEFNSIFNVLSYIKLETKRSASGVEVVRKLVARADAFGKVGSRFSDISTIENPTMGKIYDILNKEEVKV
jgi:hypothetical protein